MNQFDLAVENYQKALSINPQLWQSYQNLAAIYFNQGQYDLADENIKKAIETAERVAEINVKVERNVDRLANRGERGQRQGAHRIERVRSE